MATEPTISPVNRSGIVAFDIIDYKNCLEIVEFDLKDLLFDGMILKESYFKELLTQIDAQYFQGKAVAITCSVETIIPSWAYMSLATFFEPYASYMDFKSPDAIALDLWIQNIAAAQVETYRDMRVVIRARFDIAPQLYIMASLKLKPVVKTLMYGEVGMPKVIFKK